ncbi:MAG: acetyl-coenzyme A synthetase N-terminal domain-containing protein, partial [Erythrobacter sp.]
MSNVVRRPDPAAPTHCTAAEYAAMYRRSVESPDAFWLEQAQRLDWSSAPTIGGDWAYDPVAIKWF